MNEGEVVAKKREKKTKSGHVVPKTRSLKATRASDGPKGNKSLEGVSMTQEGTCSLSIQGSPGDSRK